MAGVAVPTGRASLGLIAPLLAVLFVVGPAARPVSAQPLAPQERLCDPTFQDCRADILTYIQQETVEIDMGFWMMTDARYANALVAARQRGVKIRLLMDPRCEDAHESCGPQNAQLKAAGIPMRNRLPSGILHWKVAIFAGQAQVQFSGANYAPFEMVPDQPYVNFTDEIVYFTNQASVVHSFMRKFDDLWTSSTEFGNYANVTGALTRSYPTYTIDPDLNFPPDQSYRDRALSAYAAERQKIDVLMFRITDETHTNAMIGAIGRGVPVRLVTDETEYRNASRLWDSYNVDKMYNAGVTVRFDGHQGIDHEKAVILYGTGMSIFGSSNWTSPSTDSQREHNYFTTKPWIHTWLADQFERKWNNQTGFSETKPFVPLPPDAPAYNLPAAGATGVPTTGVSLTWDAGLWAHNYDIYFGRSPNPPLLAAARPLGPSQSSTDYRSYTLPTLLPGTRYYWKIVSKTMAFVGTEGPVWTFVTAGNPPGTAADVDGDGRTDLVVFRKSSGSWLSLLSGQSYQASQTVAWGQSGDIPMGGDFDGDGKADRTVYRPSNGTWYILKSSTNFTTSLVVQWGASADIPLEGDIDGDGRADLVVWRPSNGTWYWLTSSSGYSYGSAGGLSWGNGSLGDQPLLGDFDGDGLQDLAVWRASNGTWYWLTSSSGYSYAAARGVQWGAQSQGDVPFTGDIDGDGQSELIVWRPGTGTWFWLTSSTNYTYPTQQQKQWGSAAAGDVPVPADFDGDRKVDLAVWRASSATWFWLPSSSGYNYAAQRQQTWGTAGDMPIVK
jgi:phosphatidylserine/phosphatidylglycerophosphate/cardiolipin synthase-like enzyme